MKNKSVKRKLTHSKALYVMLRPEDHERFVEKARALGWSLRKLVETAIDAYSEPPSLNERVAEHGARIALIERVTAHEERIAALEAKLR